MGNRRMDAKGWGRRLAKIGPVLVAGLLACATSPLGRSQLKLFPDEQLSSMGLDSFQQLERDKSVSERPEESAYVQCIADALIAELAPNWRTGWKVVVFEEESANAFAVPGRRIGVHSGMLAVAESPDQLAAVVGHELSHVLASHSNERLSQMLATQAGLLAASAMTDTESESGRATVAALGLGAQFGVLLPFSRSHEKEADLMGLDLMARAGFDPGQSAELWRNMAEKSGGQPPEWMSSQPSHESRIRDLQARMDHAESLAASARDAGKRPACKPPPPRPKKAKKQLK